MATQNSQQGGTTVKTRWKVMRGVAFAVLVLGPWLVVAGCGGSSSSVSGPSGGGSSGDGSAVVQGQVMAGRGASAAEPLVIVAVRRTLGVGLAEAQSGPPIPGATVNLRQGGTVVATTTTDSNGQFVFRGVAPGVYTVEVVVNGQLFTANVTVGAGDQAIVGVATGSAPTVQVTAISTDVYNNDAQLGHAVNIANASTSCDLVRVTQLREQGLGWGDIARRCNVHPSVIGLGRSNLSDSELDDVRENNGHGRKHGPRSGKGGGKGKGKGKA
jgi:Carboxypeptidase regulatory-like domain